MTTRDTNVSEELLSAVKAYREQVEQLKKEIQDRDVYIDRFCQKMSEYEKIIAECRMQARAQFDLLVKQYTTIEELNVQLASEKNKKKFKSSSSGSKKSTLCRDGAKCKARRCKFYHPTSDSFLLTNVN